MKPINTFEDALKQVAENHGEKTFGNLIFWEKGDPYWQEAAELYADSRSRKAANEAVKADRNQILKECVEDMFLKEPNWDSADFFSVIDKSKTRSLPLPFPEESL